MNYNLISYYVMKTLVSVVFIITLVAGYDGPRDTSWIGIDIPQWFDFIMFVLLLVLGPVWIFKTKPVKEV